MSELSGESRLSITDQVDQICENILDQNQRYSQVRSIQDTDFRDDAEEGIILEQEDSIVDLFVTTKDIPYEDIGKQYLDSYKRYEEAAYIRDHSDEIFEKEVQSTTQDAKRAIELSPTKKSSIESMLAKKVSELTFGARQIALEDAQVALDEYEASEKLFESNSAAWPIPKALSSDNINLAWDYVSGEGGSGDVLVEEDIIPVTPEERSRQASVVEQARRVIDEPDASNFIIYYLNEYKNRIVTVEDLTRFLYAMDDSAENGTDYRSRVTTLLGPKTRGRKMQSLLSEADPYAKLQYGIRVLKKLEDGRWKTIRRTRIFRAYSDGYELTEDSHTILNENAKVCDSWENMNELFGVGDELANPTHTEDSLHSETIIDEDIQPSSTEEVLEIENENAWMDQFKADVDSAIDQLVEDHLFFGDDVLSGGYIRMASASRLLGTRTARERLQSAGLISPKSAKVDEMNRSQRVESLILNVHRDIFSQKKGKKREAAIEIIRSSIADRLRDNKS